MIIIQLKNSKLFKFTNRRKNKANKSKKIWRRTLYSKYYRKAKTRKNKYKKIWNKKHISSQRNKR